jgi:hypothetical protein
MQIQKGLTSVVGQGRLWSAGGWYSRSAPSSGKTRAFRHLRFVPIAEVADASRSEKVC